MNKGSKLKFVGKPIEHNWRFTRGRNYKVLAGFGDGVPRNDGKLGAFIQDEQTFVVEDDRKNLVVKTMANGDWEIVAAVESNYHPKRELPSPIPLTHAVC